MPPEKFPVRCDIPRLAMTRALFRAAICAGAGFAVPAQALSLGPVVTHGYIGTPLRIEIPILTNSQDELDVSCIRLAGIPANYSEDIPWLTRGNLSIETTAAGKVLVIRAAAIRQPAFMMGLRAECGINLQRDYTILLDLPPLKETPPPSPEPVQTASVSMPRTVATQTPDTAGKWQIQRGDTAHNIAARLIPGQRAAQRQLAAQLLALNHEALPPSVQPNQALPEGLEIVLPALPAMPATRLPARRAEVAPLPPQPASSRPPRAEPDVQPHRRGHDTVIVSGGADLPLRLSTTLGEPGSVPSTGASVPDEQQLIAELDDKTASQIELKERLRQLEALQARLQEETARLTGELGQYPPAQSAPGAVAVTAPVHPPAMARQSTPAADDEESWRWIAAGVAGILLMITGLVLLLRRMRRYPQEPLDGDTLPLPAAPEAGFGEGEALGTPLSEADIWPDHNGHAPSIGEQARTTRHANVGQFTASGLGPASLLHVVEHDVEEHDSAIELAEIMLSFGRVQGAAQTLADYIRNNPKRAIKPWLKLLEVYRIADMRTEFDALMQQLHKNFNVKPVDWENFEITRKSADSLEQLPHIVERLIKLWGKRECQAFLYRLLRDNREGTRQGFPLAIVDEILLLLSILETELGPFRPSELEEAQAAAPAGPATYQQAGAPAGAAPAPHGNDTVRLELPASATFTQTGRFPPLPQPEPTQSFLNLDFELDLDDQSRTQTLDFEDLPDESKPEDKGGKTD